MKALALTLLIIFAPDPIDISRINKTKKAAESAYLAGNYETAAAKYKILTDSMGVSEDEVFLNMAHSYFHLNDSANSTSAYNQLISSSNKEIKSIAYQQLGVMAKNNQLLEEAESMLKSSLRANPLNQEARYDYEVVKKLLQKQNEQKQDNQDNQNQEENKDQNEENQDQEKQDQENQDQQDQQDQDSESDQENEEQQQNQENEEGKEGEQQEEEESGKPNEENKESEQPGTKEKLEEMNISEEKAQMILEAMKNNEFQYIQQRKRKPTQQQDPSKPDW